MVHHLSHPRLCGQVRWWWPWQGRCGGRGGGQWAPDRELELVSMPRNLLLLRPPSPRPHSSDNACLGRSCFLRGWQTTTGKNSKICFGSLDWTSFGWYCLNPNKTSFLGHITIYVTEPTIIFDNTRLMFISTKKLYLLFSHSMNHLSFLHLYFFMCL